MFKNTTSLAKRRAVLLGVGTLAVLSLAVTAFYHIATRADAQVAPPPAPAPQVNVVAVEPQQVRIWSEFSGRMHAVESAEIRPEVSGRITGVRFRDGQLVKAGDVLFVIDPSPYEAAVAKAAANLVSAKANGEFTRTELDRAANMIKTQAIAQRVFDERANASRVAQAAILGAEAELKQARIDLDHAFVKAPIGGRVSRAEITLGNRVQAGAGAPVLCSVVSKDEIYVDFEVDEQTYMQNFRTPAASRDKEDRIEVELAVQGDAGHPYKGTIYSFDNRIDSSSGTIRARARFANSDGRLVPGMFAKVRLASSGAKEVLLVPEQAVGSDQSKKFVYLVGADGKVVYREVDLGQQAQGHRIVLAGLARGDRVIVDGLQHVKPGEPVQAKAVPLGSGAALAAAK
ncbi:MexE family multidrug efflux RND transporter periplasmic adaptor subunit [Geomonas silvestris]|uniref:MexE family multidrug efflux RND transporter periplasmic adaptor subunit n=1 Tax=Geomonas silvestris TaxID=2740184 RepID=A0A6V8MM68_9BACT|nr:efflux RND transporter periplasmic adaptor subunit [Geomonas silvestris]GFO61024.1 MexE family multidrug efflux RND transporter periplasmic adaptor subunit [Geomonas silvestris]